MVLGLDQTGTPHSWVTPEEAARYYALNLVAWEAGTVITTLRGGMNSKTGERSILHINSIIAVRGGDYHSKNYSSIIPLSRRMLFIRDNNTCAYCGSVLPASKLEMEHVVPSSKGGRTSWTNIVSSCRPCNSKKDNKTPAEAGMKLRYVPYVPNRHEAFILNNHGILSDQKEYLLKGVPIYSRLLPL